MINDNNHILIPLKKKKEEINVKLQPLLREINKINAELNKFKNDIKDKHSEISSLEGLINNIIDKKRILMDDNTKLMQNMEDLNDKITIKGEEIEEKQRIKKELDKNYLLTNNNLRNKQNELQQISSLLDSTQNLNDSDIMIKKIIEKFNSSCRIQGYIKDLLFIDNEQY